MGSCDTSAYNLRPAPLTCSGHTRPVVNLAFSDITETGYYLISACKDGKPMLRRGDTGDWIGTFVGHKGAVWGVALNKNATRAASGAADFYVKLWDAITGKEVHSILHNHIVKSVGFSSDETRLITGSDKFIRIYDLNELDREPEIFPVHSASLRCSVFYDNDKRIASCADDKTLRLLDRFTGRETHRVTFNSCPNSLEISKDGTIITITNGTSVTFFDSRDLTKLKEVTVPTKVYSASLHPDKFIFVCGGDDLKMYKYNYKTGTEIDSFKGHFGPVHCCRFSPDGELYASGSEDGTVRLWQTNVGKTYGLWRSIDDVLLGGNDDGEISNDELLAKLASESCDEFNTSSV